MIKSKLVTGLIVLAGVVNLNYASVAGASGSVSGNTAGNTVNDMQFSGELRLRSEGRDNKDFNDTAFDKTNFSYFRLRVGLKKEISDSIRFFFQMQDSRIWGIGDNPTLTDTGEAIDVHQGYVDLSRGAHATLRVGRQELSYGSQRLVGAFWWSNNGRAFDGIKLTYFNDMLSTDLFLTKVKETSVSAAGKASGSGNNDTDFYGLYSTLKRSDTRQVSLYLLQKNDYGAGDLTLSTLGTRVAEKNISNIDYTGEAAFQFGQMASKSISAYALAFTMGYTVKTKMPVRFGVEYDRASGDDDPADDSVNTFDNLFPTNHLWYGSMDYQGWRNMESVRLSASVKPVKSHKIMLNYHIFRLLETADNWYGANGKPRAGFGGSGSKNTGSELDLLYRIVRSKNLKVETGYSHYFKGDYIRDSIANSADSDWGYMQIAVAF